jgi:dihydrofolate synthase / folylpolyglutamate synthase
MEPAAANRYLESLIPGPGSAPPAVFGLDAISSLLQGLGDPHLDRSFIHVGGTSGKGSTATFLARILAAAGYRTGLHVSPHVISLGERAQVNGTPTRPADIARLATHVRQVAEDRSLHPSYFEVLWAMALLRFAEEGTDVDVVEVGLGGRLDATNVIDSRFQILTNVGLDHTAILGATKAAILGEKQGILKPHSCVVSGIRGRELRRQLRHHAEALSSDVAFAGRDFTARRLRSHTDSEEPEPTVTFDFREGTNTFRDLALSVHGVGQVENALLAVAMARRAAASWPRVDETAIRDGLLRTSLPGRLDVVWRDPLTVFDGAHNPEKVRWLVRALESAFPGRRFVTVFRYKPRPDIWTTMNILATHGAHLILTQSSEPGDMGTEPGYDDAALRRARDEFGATHADSPHEALTIATHLATTNGWGVLVTGSIYMLQELYPRLR